jgi:outer membrane protein
VKNLSLILNGILAVAVIYLYVLHFSGDSPAQAEETAGTSAAGAMPKIAYVNSDTLLENYDFFKDKRAELEEKAQKLQADYENRAKGLQGEITAFQRNAGTMTMNQARALEEDLMKKQQNLMQYQQNLSNQLMQDEAKVQEELYDKVADYLEEYGTDQNFKVVLTYTKNSGVLYADDSLDITKTVVEGLNKRYKGLDAAENTAETPADTTAAN